MASFKEYTASGNETARTSENFSIPSFTSDEIKVRVDKVLKVAGNHYNIDSYTTNGGTVTFTSGNIPASNAKVYIYRDTKILNSASSDVEAKATYSGGMPLYHDDLNNNQKQVLRALEEKDDQKIQAWDLASGIVETDSIKDGTIVNADVNANAAIAQSKLNIADASGSASGYMSASNFTKLAGIETGATADQTNIEIRDAVEAASNSNVFTDADHTKLDGIETAATADQTDAEIRAAVEAASDSNVFTDADHTKLDGIAAGAEVNVQSDWNQTSNSADDFIKNKPPILEIIDEDDFASDTATKAPSQQSVKAYITTTSQPKDDQLTTLAGMPSATASILADSTALTSTTTELNLLDGKSVVTSVSGSSTDVQLPTAKAVNDQIVAIVQDIGGFYPIANRTSFPNTNPDPNDDAGTIVSIADVGGLIVNSSGVATNAATAGGTTVTINGIDATLRGTTIAAGKGMLVQTTSTLNTYDYHRLVVDEAGVATAQTLVSDFGDRYQVTADSTAPTSHPDSSALQEGDLWFDGGTNTMKVYDGSTYSAVTSIGDYKLLTLVNSDGSSPPTLTNTEFNLKDGSNAANVTSAGQLLISINGILQKPNAGTSIASSGEGFCLVDSDTIKFATAPGTGASIFITLIGSATTVNVPATNSVVEATLQSDSVSEAKLKTTNTGSNGQFLQKSASGSGLTWATAGGSASIADGSIEEVKLNIHADPSGTNKFLGFTSNGMEWAVPPDTNTQVGGATGVDFNDDVKARFGTGNDLEIYHDSSTNHSFIKETGTGSLVINANDFYAQNVATETMIKAASEGAVELYHAASKKLETTSAGVTVTGAVTATSFTGSGANLTGLPAGGNVITAVADGAIANNKPVIIKTNGKVAEVKNETTAITPTFAGTGDGLDGSGTENQQTKIIRLSGNKVFVTYWSNSVNASMNSTIYGRVGTSKNNGSIAWGTLIQINAGSNDNEWVEPVYDSNADRVVVFYTTGGNYELKARVVSFSGTTPTAHAETTIRASNSTADKNYLVTASFDSGTNQILVAAIKNTTHRGNCYVCTVDTSDNSLDVGSAVQTSIPHLENSTSNNTVRSFKLIYVPHAQRHLLVCSYWQQQGNQSWLRGDLCTLSGTGTDATVTWHSHTYIRGTANTEEYWRFVKMAYDSSKDKVVMLAAAPDQDAAYYILSIVGGNTNSITVDSGIDNDYGIGYTGNYGYGDIQYHAGQDKLIVWYINDSDDKGHWKLGTWDSGNDSITWGSETDTDNDYTLHGDGTPSFNQSHSEFCHSYGCTVEGSCIAIMPVVFDQAGSYDNWLRPFQVKFASVASNLVHQNHYMGFADQAYTDGQTATIKTYGNNVSTLSGLTPGTLYYVQGDGTLGTSADTGLSGYFISGTPVAGTAISATKLLIRDPGTRV